MSLWLVFFQYESVSIVNSDAGLPLLIILPIKHFNWDATRLGIIREDILTVQAKNPVQQRRLPDSTA